MENPSYHTMSLSSLLCQETGTCLDDECDEDPFLNLTDYAISASDYEDEYIQVLLERETSSSNFGNHESSKLEDWTKNARLDAIDYILSNRDVFRFQFETAYLSVTYFDRFLSKRSIDSGKSWAVQLLSVACLSLAAKLDECRVPALSEFRGGEYNFESKVIQKMELLVLNTLEWKMASVTPFAYLPYFINKFCNESPSRRIISRITQHIFAIARDVNLMDHHPSAIAFAALLAALDQRLTRKALELKINAIPSSRFRDIEDIFKCYNLMQRLELDKIKMPQLSISADLSPLNLIRIDALQNPSAASSISSNERKRLAFRENYGSS
ncbi:hypothetical protein Nepgr_005020 [Nepenthes gracilis]|uniref:Cyclin-like domain-containing protein n=1 Tax=Nepenthes gracilis TaxID=150966 RepID=A0AAD3XG42_NEPGR|nr:hypothetical protein Nepgr_005020 [Nepenthes gracilis]